MAENRPTLNHYRAKFVRKFGAFLAPVLLIYMGMKTPSLKNKKTRIAILAVIFCGVLVQSAFRLAKEKTVSQRPSVGYLSKVGEEYVVAWNEPRGVVIEKFNSLVEATDFAKNKLSLTTDHIGGSGLEMERVWIEERFSRYQLFWKMSSTAVLNRLTFNNPREAQFFATSFKKGLYSPSPIGHSILLLGNTLSGNEIAWLKHGLDFSQKLGLRNKNKELGNP